MDTLQLYAALLLCVVPSSVCGEMTFDDLTPLVLKRLEEVRKVLVPVPQDVLNEAMFNLASNYIPIDSETELCRNHSSILFDSFLKNEIWALKIVDASSKIGVGGIDGNVMDLGSFDQCLSVTAPGHLFTGQHCVVETQGILPPEMDFNSKRNSIPQLRYDVVFSVCVPSSCTAQDIKTHMDITLNSVNASSIIYNSSCSSSQPLPYTNRDYFSMFFIFFVAILASASSYYDHKTQDTDKKDLWMSFSVRHNIKQMLSTSQPPDSICCLHGLRVISMAWVLLAHRLAHLALSPNLRAKTLLEGFGSYAWAPMQELQLPVEIFFLLSGLLASYNFFKDRYKNRPFNYLEMCITRYRRLTPVMAVVVLLYSSLLVHISDGPLFRRLVVPNSEACLKYWWSSLLYIANYVNPYEFCNGPTWYLNVDFQLHLLAPLLLIPLYKNKRKGMLLVILAFLATVAAGLSYTYIMKLPGAGPFRMDRRVIDRAMNGYIQTQYKAGSFLMGIVLGYLLYNVKKEQLLVKITQLQLWLGWMTSVTLIVCSVFGVTYFLGAHYRYNPWIDTGYNVLHKYTLSLGVAWIILACSLGYGGVVNRALSWSVLVPLSRLTYCAYLLHWAVQMTQAYRTRTQVSTDTFNIWYLFTADFTISYILAALLFVTVEAPVSNALNALCSDKKKKIETDDVEQTVQTPAKDNTLFCTKC